MGLGQEHKSMPHMKIGGFGAMVKSGVVALFAMGAMLGGATAQEGAADQFQPVKYVNNDMITRFELSQRMGFLELLNFQGDVEQEALNGLIDDRLRHEAAKRLGVTLTEADITAGMEEFASRGSLNAQQFIDLISERGIAPETFRDFVSAGIIWRQVVGARFGNSVVISEAAIDRALSNLQVDSALSVTLAEIVLDASGENRSAALALARNLQIDFIKGRAFADAAREVSIAPSARDGGNLPPKLLSELPKEVAVLVRGLPPEQVSTPIILDDKLYIYQKLANETVPVDTKAAPAIDYAEITLPADAPADTALAQIRANVDNCDDLFSYATAQGNIAVIRHKEVQANERAALQLLDSGEISPPLAGNKAIMLCARGIDPAKTASRDEVRNILKNQRLSAIATVYLSELRADALIRDP